MSHRDDPYFWQPVPLCFACGRELGLEPGDVIYVGWGNREGREEPAWVATLCPHRADDAAEGRPSPCLEVARTHAAAEGRELTPEEYRHWLETA